jgi:predicted esterase
MCCALLMSSASAAGGAEDEAEAKPPAATIEHLDVHGDRALEVVMGPAESDAVIVYLHGVCGDPLAFSSWAAAAARHGTLISLRGDQACKSRPGRTKWSYDPKLVDARIRRAVERVSQLRSDRGMKPLSEVQATLMGYSQGAKRVELLAYRYPERYRRVAVIAIAKEPLLLEHARTERVLLVAGGYDARQHIFEAQRKLAARGHTARYLELPKARHGEYGPRALEVMADGLEWLFKRPSSD